jgi:hypothetical protein
MLFFVWGVYSSPSTLLLKELFEWQLFKISRFLELLLILPFVHQVSSQCWPNVTCSGPTTAAFPGVWDENIYASATRNVTPNATLSWPDLTATPYNSASVTLSGNGSIVVYDFGVEVGGIVSINCTTTETGDLYLAFSEAKNYVGESSDSSNGGFEGADGAIYTSFEAGITNYTMPSAKLRGGFRYLTVFLQTNTSATVTIDQISVQLDFQPTWSNLQAYQGYFYSNDDLLNRIWYAGAYSVQSNSVPVDTGRHYPAVAAGWQNDAILGPGQTILVDGAKRDRAVWPGDMGVAVPSAFVSLGDLDSAMNSLQVMYDYQASTGAFDESGPPLSETGSDTYHMWTMIGTYNYFLYTNDTDFLNTNWAGYQLAMSYILAKVDSSGLLNVTGIRDWGRLNTGGYLTEANIILYNTLITGAKLATWASNSTLSAQWTTSAATLRTAINENQWSSAAGCFMNNEESSTLYPQDANSLSLMYGIPESNSTATALSKVHSIEACLEVNWTPIGPVPPELPDNISPFITSFELLGRLAQRDTDTALELLRMTWGWIVNNANSTQSTLLEGYLSDGTFGYRATDGYHNDASYTSHSHGWSSGPTSGLTNFVLGLDVVEPAGQVWSLAPQTGNLTSVEGGFTTGLGAFQALWTNSSTEFSLNWTTPVGTTGTVTLPLRQTLGTTGGGIVTLIVNGESVNVTEGATGVTIGESTFEGTVTVSVSGGVGNATVS